MPIQGLAYFPGITQIVEGSVSFAAGITPSQATLTIAPQANFTAQIGTLTFFDQFTGTEINWQNCRLDTNSFERNKDGLVWRLTIYDRRWKWQATGGGGCISLGANLRNGDGTLIVSTQKSVQQLAIACLEAMSEDHFDISVLSSDVDDSCPEIMWDAALPAQMLEELAEQFGCRVVLGLDDVVRICKVGEGGDLPDTPDIMTNSLAMKIPGMPKTIIAVCSPDRFQVDLELEPVGIENNDEGTLIPIDELSYVPPNGWANTDLDFEDVYEEFGRRCQNLAKQSVYRYYRVKFPIHVPGYIGDDGTGNSTISNPWQIKIEDTQVEYMDEDMGLPEFQRRCRPAAVAGVFYNEDDGVDENNVKNEDVSPYQSDPFQAANEEDDDDDDAETRQHPWHLGSEPGLSHVKNHYVVFAKPIYMNTNVGGAEFVRGPAQLYLRAAIRILGEKSFAPVRSLFIRNIGGDSSEGERYEVFSDMQVWHYWDYDSKLVVSNENDLWDMANHYLDGIYQEYQATVPQTITYAGLKWINLDGAVQHVHYQVSKGGCKTTASRNNEQLHRIQPFNFRKLMGKLKAGVKDARANRPTLRSFNQHQT